MANLGVHSEVGRLREVMVALHPTVLQSGGLEVDWRVVVAPHIARAILDFVSAHEIDVIAMSTHGRGASRLLIGSVADKVLRGSEVPLLLRRPPEVRENEEPEIALAATAGSPASRG